MQICDFSIGQRNHDLSVNTVLTNNIHKAQRNIVQTVLSVNHCRYGQRGINTAQQTLAQMADGHRNCIVGYTLTANDATAGLSDKIFDFVLFELGIKTVIVH